MLNMNVQPMIYNPVSQPLPYPVNTQCQHGDEQHLQTNPTLLHGPSGPHIQPTIISAPPPSNSMPFGISIRKARALIILGVAQVILGILSIVFNGAGYYVHTTYTFYGPGLWAGVPFVASGVIGVAAGLKKTKTTVITTLVLAILSAVLAAAQLALAATSLHYNEALYDLMTSSYIPGYSSRGYWDFYTRRFHGAMAVDSFLLIFAVVQAGMAVPSSALACNSLCCQRMEHKTTVNAYYSYGGAYYNPQMAHPVQFQPHPGSINYRQMSTHVNNSETVSPTDVYISSAPEYEASSRPGGPKSQRLY